MLFLESNAKNEHLRYCLCIDDIIKIKECSTCPNFNDNTLKFEETCTYECSENTDRAVLGGFHGTHKKY